MKKSRSYVLGVRVPKENPLGRYFVIDLTDR